MHFQSANLSEPSLLPEQQQLMPVSNKPPGVLAGTAAIAASAAGIVAPVEAPQSYLQHKYSSQEYATQWRDLQKQKPFALWMHKPNTFEQFFLEVQSCN